MRQGGGCDRGTKASGCAGVPGGYPPMQMISPGLSYHLGTDFGKENLFGIIRNIPTNKRSKNWRARLNMCVISSLLAVECRSAVIFSNNSAIQHIYCEKGLFAVILMKAEEVIGYYYASFAYSNLCGQKQLKKTYGELAMGLLSSSIQSENSWS